MARQPNLAVVSSLEGDTLEAIEDEYRTSLQAERKSPSTIRSYMETHRRFAAWLGANGHSTDVRRITAPAIESYMRERLGQVKAISAAIEFRALRRFFGWAVRRELVKRSPFEKGLRQPKVEDTLPPVLSAEDLHTLMESVKGRTFRAVRDRAILWLLIDSGMRRGELASIRRDDIDRQQRTVRVTGKTGTRDVAFGVRAAEHLFAYDRARRSYAGLHPQLAAEDAYFIGPRGALTASGVSQLFAERTKAALGRRLGVHVTRHTRAHFAHLQGIATPDLETQMGWRHGSPMVSRYGRSAAAARARKAFQEKSLGDLLPSG